MSDEKVCPLMPQERRYPPDPSFATCLRDKCAMWRVGLKCDTTIDGHEGPLYVTQFCGLAGKP